MPASKSIVSDEQKTLIATKVDTTLSSIPFPLPQFVRDGFQTGMKSELEKSIGIRNNHVNLNDTWKKFIAVLVKENKLVKFQELMAKYNAKSVLRIMEKLHPGQDIYHTEFHQGGEMGNDVPRVVEVSGTEAEKLVLAAMGEQKGISHDVVQGLPFLGNEIESAKIDFTDFEDMITELDLSPKIMKAEGLAREDISTLGEAISSTIVEHTYLVFGGDTLAAKRLEIEKQMYANDPAGFKQRNENLHFLNVIGYGLEMSDVNRLAFQKIVENLEYDRHIKKVSKAISKTPDEKFSDKQSLGNPKAFDIGLGQGFRMLCEMHNKFRYVPGSKTAELNLPTRTNTAKQILATGLGLSDDALKTVIPQLMNPLSDIEKAATAKAEGSIKQLLSDNKLPPDIIGKLSSAAKAEDQQKILSTAGVTDNNMQPLIARLATINQAKQDEITTNKSEFLHKFLQDNEFSSAEPVMTKLLVTGITARELRDDVLALADGKNSKLEATAYLFTTANDQQVVRDMMHAVRMFSVTHEKKHLEVYNNLLGKHGADLARIFITSSISPIASDDVGFALNRDISKIIENAEDSGVKFSGNIDRLAWYKQAVLLDKDQALPKIEKKLADLTADISAKLDQEKGVDLELAQLIAQRDKLYLELGSSTTMVLDAALLKRADIVGDKIQTLNDWKDRLASQTSLASEMGNLVAGAKLATFQDLKTYYQQVLQGTPEKAKQFIHQTVMSAALQQGVFLMQQRVEKNPALFASAAAASSLKEDSYQKQLLTAMVKSAAYRLEVPMTREIAQNAVAVSSYKPPATTALSVSVAANMEEQQQQRDALAEQQAKYAAPTATTSTIKSKV
jgi:hypothetical protein